MDATTPRPATPPDAAGVARPSPIAVVGIGCIFPGAVGAQAFWSLLMAGDCAVGPVPARRWDAAALPASAAGQAGFVADADCFDAAFFGISPREAAALDPRQRLALQVAWWALEDAGIAPDSLKGGDLGVFVGAVNGEYAGAFDGAEAIEPHLGVGLSNAVIANRISHVLGVHGPSMAIDTACSASLVAVHQACRSLQAGDCGVALAGGVGLMLSPVATVALGQAGMLAPDGRCKSFDAAADGYGRGEGCGLVVLKRLADALADGDRIHAVLRGSSTNHDGLSNGITAPNGLSQERLMHGALAAAGVAPEAVAYVEAHGTGTLLGDPTETRALGHVYGQVAGRTAPLLIGSVKTNIGHLEAAAGVAGLVKLVLAVRHGRIPASLHYVRPNPHIDFDALGLRVADAAMPWPAGAGPRLGAVSSFGFGGANAHVVVEEAPRQQAPPAAAAGPQLLVLSAASAPSLKALAGDTAAALRAPAAPWPALAALSQHGRSPLRHRLAVVAEEAGAAAGLLAGFAAGRAAAGVVDAVAGRRPPRLALLCPGQGAQRPGMARDLLRHDPVFRVAIEEADAVLDWSLAELLASGSTAIDGTEFTQPALLAVGVGLARTLAARGVQPQVLSGHSLGEYTAAVIAGGIAYADALRLVAARGRLMARLPGPGAMAAVFAGEDEVLPLLPAGVAVAAVNGPRLVTISGAPGPVAQAGAAFEAAGIRVRPLRVATAFHSPLVEPMLDEFGAVAATVAWQPLRLPVVSNVTGELLPAGHVYDAAYWVRHTRAPVRFAAGLQVLVREGMDTVVELGAVPVLAPLVADNTPQLRAVPALLPDADDRAALWRALGTLHVHGARIAWPAARDAAAPGDSLPRYPFAKDRYPLRMGAAPFGVVAAGPVAVTAQASAAPADAAAAAPAPAPADRPALRARLVALVAGLLGIDAARLDPAAPFLELGADSLILIQAVGRIESEFGVRIPVRAFFEHLSTIDAVCDELLRAGPAPAPSDAPSDAPAAAPAAPAPAAAHPPAAAPRPAAGTFSDVQRRHLEQLGAAYVARTAASRAYAQRFRPVLADSRGSAGFRFSTKEMLYPIVGRRAAGSRIWDLDGNEYIDISMGFGVQLFGHDPPFLREALAESLERGLRLGPQSDAAGEVAELIARLTGVERVAFCNTGTEAVMTALRLARTATGRHRIAVFRDSYHGHFDGVLGETHGDPWSVVPRIAGIAPNLVADLAIFEYGSAAALERLQPRLGEFAAVLVEPVQSRNPALQPATFLHALRAMTRAAGAVLVFDEVLTGFRIAPGGAQSHFGVRADLVTYGKIVGGGLPVGVVAGRSDLMAGIDGGTWQYGDASFPAAEATFFAGTFNKHPLVMAAARAVLQEIGRMGDAGYAALNRRTANLVEQLDALFAEAGAPIRMARFGSLFRFAFRDNLDPFFHHLLHRGLYIWEGRNLFLSTAHSAGDVAAIVERVADALSALRAGGFIAPPAAPEPQAPQPAVELPLSLAQRQLATLAALSPQGSAAYTVAAALECRGDLDAGRLADGFTALVRRHAALRAAIDLEAGVQRVAHAVPFMLRRQPAGAGEALHDALLRELAQPFDLANPTALRATLFELDAGHAVLLVAAHHALVDGQSLQVLLEELAALYGGETLHPAPDYALLAARMAQAGSTPADAAHRSFWQQALQGAPAGIDLPCARMRPAVRRFAGARVALDLDPASLRRLAARAGRLGLSASQALAAAFAAGLRRSGAPADMVLGLPFAGRQPDEARAVGYCAHLLPLRLQVAATAGVEDLMRQVRQRFLDAVDHAAYPMARIIDGLGLARDPARPPLVNVTFNVDRVPALPMLPGVQLAPCPLPVAAARFDIGCNVLDWQDGARVELDYDSDLFAAADMQALLHSFVAMIERFGAAADAPFDERAAVRRRWDEPAAPAAGPGLLQRLRASVVADPGGCAVQVDGEAGIDRATLDRWSDAIAEAIDDFATRPGPVALLLERGAGVPAAMLAAWKAGRAWLPLEPGLPAARLNLLLRSAAPSVIVVDATRADLREITAGVAATVLPLPAIAPPAAAAPPRPLPHTDPRAVAYLLFTSGSTGTPKLVAVPHGAVRHYLDGIVEALDLPPGLRCAVVSTFAADLGLTAVLPALFHRGSLLIASAALARDAERFAALLRRTPVDLLKIVPSHLEALLAASQPPLPRTHLVLGGETARPALLETLARLPRTCRVFNHFGPTEATVGVLVGEWDGGSGTIRFQRPIGAALVALLDAQGRPCGFGEAGEVVIGGPPLACGYAGEADNAAGAFTTLDAGRGPERVYRTGDLGRLHGDGSIELLGRRDDQIKIRGHRIEPAEITTAITRDARIRSAAVVQRTTEGDRPCLVAYVVPARAGDAIDTAALLARLRDTLPEAMVPAAVVVLPALPVTANGKLDQAALPAPVLAAPGAREPQAGAGEVQALLLPLWRTLLGRPDIGPQHDFFASGGDSILAIQLMARLHQAGWRAQAADLYACPTLEGFAARVRPAARHQPAPAAGDCLLLPSQLRLLERLGQWPDHFNLSAGLAPAPWVTPQLLARALQALVQQHDALRLRFTAEGGRGRARFGAPVAPQVFTAGTGETRAALLARMQSSLAPAQGRLVAAAWIEPGGDEPAAVVLAVHHLVCDGLSLQVLLQDLRQALLDLHAQRDPQLGERTSSVQEWAKLLQRLALQEASAAEAPFWQLTGTLPPPDLPQAAAGADDTVADERGQAVSLTAQQTAQLLHAGGSGEATVEDRLVAAATLALGEWTGEPVACFELEGHGRETGRAGDADLDLGRTVGWFTSRYQAWFDLEGVAPERAAQAVAEQRRAIPGRGFGYGLLRYLAPAGKGLAAGPAPLVSLNYLGRIQPPPADAFAVGSWLPGRMDRGPEVAPSLPRLHRIAIEAAVSGDCLHVVWQFNPLLHASADLARVAQSFARHLAAMCGATAAAGSGATGGATESPEVKAWH